MNARIGPLSVGGSSIATYLVLEPATVDQNVPTAQTHLGPPTLNYQRPLSSLIVGDKNHRSALFFMLLNRGSSMTDGHGHLRIMTRNVIVS